MSSPFLAMLGFFGDDPFHEYDPWAGRAEKSASAKAREWIATRKFDVLREKVERAVVGYNERILRLVRLGCKPESLSLFRLLPEVTVDMILDFARPEGFRAAAPTEGGTAVASPVQAAAATSTQLVRKSAATVAALKKAACREAAAAAEGVSPHIDVVGLCEPGRKHTYFLLAPDCHLTGPCWRDFSRHVRKYAGWKPKRVEATPMQKKEFRIARQGKAYFVYAIYSVPGTPRKKQAAAASAGKKRPALKSAQKSAAPVAAGRERPAPAIAERSDSKWADEKRTSLPSPNLQQLQPLPSRIPTGGAPPPMPPVPKFDPTDAAVAARMEAARRAAGYVLLEDTTASAAAKRVRVERREAACVGVEAAAN